jgi:cell division protein FtsA
LREFWSAVVGGRGSIKERPAYRSILDLGTEQIKALVLELKGDRGFVVGVGRDRLQPTGWTGGPVVDVQRMARSCDLALRQAEDMAAEICNGHVVPDWAVLGLPNYLTMGEAFTVTHHRPNSGRRISDRELRKVVERAERLALRQLGRKAESLQSSPGLKIELLEATVTDIRVDGHSVTNPLGFRGQNLTVAVFNVVASSSHLRAVEALAKDLGLEILATVSGWQPLASTLGKKDGICIDFGGKATDIVLIRNGKAWTTASLPFGGSDFTRYLAEVFDLSWEDAESLKLAYGRGRVGEPFETQVGETTRRVMEVWVGGVEATLNRLSGSHPLPHRLNLCGGGTNLPGVVDAVRSYPWMQGLNFTRHPQVRLMQPREVSRVLDRTGQLRGQQDVAPLALADYTIAGDDELDSVERLLWRVKRPAIFESIGGRA